MAKNYGKKIKTLVAVSPSGVETYKTTPVDEVEATEEQQPEAAVEEKSTQVERCKIFDYAGELSFLKKPITKVAISPDTGIALFQVQFECTPEEIEGLFKLGK